MAHLVLPTRCSKVDYPCPFPRIELLLLPLAFSTLEECAQKNVHRLACELLANVLKNNEKTGIKQTRRVGERDRVRERKPSKAKILFRTFVL